MATQVQFRGGTTAQNNAFTGASKELTVDTDKDVVVVHDGATAGGHPLMAEDGSNSALALGSAGTPALKFTNDSNTGIYSPGANQIALSTGGTGRLFVNSAGNVGIKTSNPGGPLEVQTAAGERIILDSAGSSQQPRIQLVRDGGADFAIQNSIGTFEIQKGSDDIYRYSNDAHQFYTAGIDQRMVIDSSGNVGIGTGTPDAKLKIQSADSDIPQSSMGIRQNNGANTAQTTLDFEVDPVNSTARILSNATSSPRLAFYTSNQPALHINESQRVGIGTTNPSTKLEITGSTGIARTAGGYTFREITGGGERAGIHSDTNNSLIFKTAGAVNAVHIDGSGRLLVGTSTSTAAGGRNASFLIEGADAAKAGQSIIRNTNDAGAPALVLAKSRGTTNNNNTVVSNNDGLGTLAFAGADGTDKNTQAAFIAAFVDGDPDPNADGQAENGVPGRLVFSTAASGASSPTTRMTIKNNGTINFANVQTFADDAAAGSGGLVSGDVYKTSAGDLKIKA